MAGAARVARTMRRGQRWSAKGLVWQPSSSAVVSGSQSGVTGATRETAAVSVRFGSEGRAGGWATAVAANSSGWRSVRFSQPRANTNKSRARRERAGAQCRTQRRAQRSSSERRVRRKPAALGFRVDVDAAAGGRWAFDDALARRGAWPARPVPVPPACRSNGALRDAPARPLLPRPSSTPSCPLTSTPRPRGRARKGGVAL